MRPAIAPAARRRRAPDFDSLIGLGLTLIVAPIGPLDGVQKLRRLVRHAEGFEATDLADVRFVPLIPGIAARL